MVYSTKQKKIIMDYLELNASKHFTVEEIKRELEDKNMFVGQTTIYRLLNSLVEDGIIRKFIIDNTKSACFQYLNKNQECHEHFHMICEKCNKLIHLDCDETDKLINHISDHHGFAIDESKIIFYGICKDCQKGEHSEKN